MQTILTFINTGLAIYCGYLAQQRYHSTVVMILVLIASYALFRAFAQLFILYYYRYKAKYNPNPTLHPFDDDNWDDRDEWEDSYLDLGWRAMVVTEELEDDKYIPCFKAMVDEAIEYHNKPETIFELRLNHVHKKSLPYQAIYTVCGPEGKGINKCAKTWYYSRPLKNLLKTRREPNKDVFIYDGTMDIEGVGPTQFTVFIAFENRLPVTVNNPYKKKLEEAKALEAKAAAEAETAETVEAVETTETNAE